MSDWRVRLAAITLVMEPRIRATEREQPDHRAPSPLIPPDQLAHLTTDEVMRALNSRRRR